MFSSNQVHIMVYFCTKNQAVLSFPLLGLLSKVPQNKCSLPLPPPNSDWSPAGNEGSQIHFGGVFMGVTYSTHRGLQSPKPEFH